VDSTLTWLAEHLSENECNAADHLPCAVAAVDNVRTDLAGEIEKWRNLVGDLFHGEESPMLVERGDRLVCVDCGGAIREDIEHEDGCTVGPLYRKLLASRQVESPS
jgi:hypothetical protein